MWKISLSKVAKAFKLIHRGTNSVEKRGARSRKSCSNRNWGHGFELDTPRTYGKIPPQGGAVQERPRGRAAWRTVLTKLHDDIAVERARRGQQKHHTLPENQRVAGVSIKGPAPEGMEILWECQSLGRVLNK